MSTATLPIKFLKELQMLSQDRRENAIIFKNAQ